VRNAEFTNGSSVLSQTSGDADAGFIKLFATGEITFADMVQTNPSGLFTNSLGDVNLGTHGDAGPIDVTARLLTMTGGTRIDSSTRTNGNGGTITVTTTDGVSISTDGPFSRATGIYTRTIGNELCSGACGNAGGVLVTTGDFQLAQGGAINVDTSSTGHGGAATVVATNGISISGTMLDGTPSGIFSRTVGTTPDAGSGGGITLTAGQSVTISDGASVSASSTGPGNAGNISINAGQRFEMRNSSVKTEAAQASGGNIDIQAVDSGRLVNSTISTSVLGGAGSGGNITIDPKVFVMQASEIIARAVQGAGGNITITTPLFLADSTSLVSASSQFGLNGTVTIQSPTSNLSESLGTLTSKPSEVQSLLTQRCAALANGQASSFVVAGREQLPSDPGGWLTSPLALAGLDGDLFREGTVAEGTSNLAPRTSGLLANDRVSLRRLTPVGFLIANFADSEATGCRS
jgi:large exoprotein involved in heme utilization and adhesion